MTIKVVIMKLTTVKEFRDHATKFLRSRDPVLITRRGKPAGIYVSLQKEEDLPLEFRKELMLALAGQVRKSLQDHGLTEKDVLDDFETSREARR
jgi:PHD/YefM family antitoxin component YafN of YafNO toxin-antitoxin module